MATGADQEGKAAAGEAPDGSNGATAPAAPTPDAAPAAAPAESAPAGGNGNGGQPHAPAPAAVSDAPAWGAGFDPEMAEKLASGFRPSWEGSAAAAPAAAAESN